MNPELSDKFAVLITKVEDEEIKKELFMIYLKLLHEIEQLTIEKESKKGCIPCISNCSNNTIDIGNDNEVEAHT